MNDIVSRDILSNVSHKQHRVARYLVRGCEGVNLNLLDMRGNECEKDNG